MSACVQVSKHAGYIECDTFEEYKKLLDESYDQLIDDGHISTNVSNDFELSGDIEIIEMEEEDIGFYESIK